VQTLWGAPITYTPFLTSSPNLITGDWDTVVVGVRQDIRYLMDPSAVLADENGKVIISGFQDNTTPLKVWARFACTILNPVTRKAPTGAIPFGATDVQAWAPTTSTASAPPARSRDKAAQ
jgi:hypothetical protein